MKHITILFAGVAGMALALAAQAAPVRPAITGVSHLAVFSADMAKSDAFYTHNLGAMKAADPEDAKGVRYYFNPRQFVEVLPLPAGFTSTNRMDHAALITADAEGMRKYLAANKIKVPAHVTKGSDGSQWFEVKDPEGIRIQFVQPSATPPQVPLNPVSSHMIHFGMIVQSKDLEDTFYKKVLGFRPYWYGGMKPENPTWISQQVPDGSDWVEYMLVKLPVDQATSGVFNHFALGVGNMEKTVTLLTDGDRISEKNDGPKIGKDGKWQFNMYDPDLTRAEFMEFQHVTKPCCSPFTASDPKEE